MRSPRAPRAKARAREACVYGCFFATHASAIMPAHKLRPRADCPRFNDSVLSDINSPGRIHVTPRCRWPSYCSPPARAPVAVHPALSGPVSFFGYSREVTFVKPRATPAGLGMSSSIDAAGFHKNYRFARRPDKIVKYCNIRSEKRRKVRSSRDRRRRLVIDHRSDNIATRY